MLRLARTSLGLLGLALIAPMGVEAQDIATSVPSGYQPPAPAMMGLDGTPMPKPVAAPAAPVHKHKGRTLCASCAAKQDAMMPPGRIVGCEHSKNGVCTACQAALNMPGPFVMANGQPTMMAANQPGRAMVSEAGMAEPAPVGVVQANFSQGGPMGASAAYAPQAMPPGRAIAESNAGHDPYQSKSGPFPRPHILGHLFGWSGIGAERAEEKARKKAEVHAMISYDNSGMAPVEDLPASMVFGKKR